MNNLFKKLQTFNTVSKVPKEPKVKVKPIIEFVGTIVNDVKWDCVKIKIGKNIFDIADSSLSCTGVKTLYNRVLVPPTKYIRLDNVQEGSPSHIWSPYKFDSSEYVKCTIIDNIAHISDLYRIDGVRCDADGNEL